MKGIIQNYFKGNYLAFYEKYLPDARVVGVEQYRARCPFPGHEDKDPSFTFNSQHGGYYCHGCGKKGGFFHFYAKMHGLDTKRDFSKILKGIASDFGIAWEERKSKVVKTYDYTDFEGNLLFQVCRMEPKSFRQRQPGANGKWIWNLKGITPVLYKLPQVLAASEVLIVEGEKDVDVLVSLGFTATTCPMGAKKWKDSYNESLHGKHVVLIPDNDNEGREHMAQVGASLLGVAASMKWVDLPNLPSKGDVSDWVAKIGNKETAAERLAVMIERAGSYDPPKQASIEDAVLEARDFAVVEIAERRWIVGPWLTEQSISLISGWRNVGKTHFALGLLDAVTRKKPFGPWSTGVSVPCLYLDGEMPAQDVIERLKGLNSNKDRLNPLFVYSDHYASTLGLSRANLLSERWRSKMKSLLLTRGVKLWVVDNLASLARGIDENIKRDWDPINSWLLDLRFAGIATMLLHHTGKDGDQRGTSAREDNIDVSAILKRPHDYVPEDGARFICHFTKTRVRTGDLKLVADTQFQLSEDENSRTVWTWSNVKKEIRAEILRLLDEGHKYEAITETLGITKGRVSQVKASAIKDGLLNSKCKLTQSGWRAIQGDSEN